MSTGRTLEEEYRLSRERLDAIATKNRESSEYVRRIRGPVIIDEIEISVQEQMTRDELQIPANVWRQMSMQDRASHIVVRLLNYQIQMLEREESESHRSKTTKTKPKRGKK